MSPDVVVGLVLSFLDTATGRVTPSDRRRNATVRLVSTDVTLGAPRLFVSKSSRRARARWTKAQIVGVVSQDTGVGVAVSVP